MVFTLILFQSRKKLLDFIDSNRVKVFIDTVTLTCGTFTVNQSYQLVSAKLKM